MSELETLGPIDRSPGIPGSDKKPKTYQPDTSAAKATWCCSRALVTGQAEPRQTPAIVFVVKILMYTA